MSASTHPLISPKLVLRLVPSLGFLIVAVLLLAGCSLPQAQPDLTRYYMLTATTEKNAAGTAEEALPRVGLRTVNVPEFLRGKLMLARISENEVRYVDEARWAEPLDPALGRVLRDDLSAGGLVRIASRPTDERDFDVVVQLRQCEGVLQRGSARLAAHIEVYTAGIDPKLVAQDEFSTEVAGWDGRNFAQLAGKLSVAAGALAERIAALVPRKNS